MRQDPATTSAPDRLESTAIGHDRRRTEGCPSGSSPVVRRVPARKNEDEPGSSRRDRKESIGRHPREMLAFRADTSRCPPPMVSERTPHEEGGRRNVCEGVTRATPANPKSRRWQHRRMRRERDRPARQLLRKLQPTRNRRIPEVTRAASARTGNGTERVSPTHERSWTNNGWDGRDCNGMQSRSDGDAGHHRSSSIREDGSEGNLEGEQSPGRVGQRSPE